MEFVNRVNDTDLLYGSSQENDIGRYIKYYGGTKVLINYAKGNEKVVGLIDKVKRSLRSRKKIIYLFCSFLGEIQTWKIQHHKIKVIQL